MELKIYDTAAACGEAAGRAAAEMIRETIERKGNARIILATGASQFAMLETLVSSDIDWSTVTAFHLDEYIDLPETHPASFRKYLKERFADRAGSLRRFHYVNGASGDPEAECRRLGALIREGEIDVACIGIGENGHLAFNDPPADFETDRPYLVVNLDEACRRQQLGEGWFPTLADVPERAISMSVKRIMMSRRIVCTVPDERKARAVKGAVEGPVTQSVPASILQNHRDCVLFLDAGSSSLLERR